MNTYYRLVGDHIIVKDEFNNYKYVKKYKNIENILVQENIIEHIKNEQNYIIYKYNELKSKKNKVIDNIIISSILALFSAIIINFSIYFVYFNIAFISKILFLSNLVMFPIYTSPLIYNIIKYNKTNKKLKNLNKLYNNLDLIIKDQYEISKTINSSNIVENDYTRVNDKKEIDLINNYINNYYVKKKILKR